MQQQMLSNFSDTLLVIKKKSQRFMWVVIFLYKREPKLLKTSSSSFGGNLTEFKLIPSRFLKARPTKNRGKLV